MQILVREEKQGKTVYTWKKVVKSSEYYLGKFLAKDGLVHYEAEILKVKNDFRKNHVVCRNCGKLIKNTPEAIEKHYADRERKVNCLKCPSMRIRSTDVEKKIRYKLKEGNTYTHTTQQEVKLVCNYDYSETPINTAKDPCNKETSPCKYFQCRKSGMTDIGHDFFSKYPRAFEILITSANLINNGWSLYNTGENTDTYITKCNNKSLYAICDKNGIVKNFVISVGYDNISFVYLPIYKEYVNKSNDRYRLAGPVFDSVKASTEKAIHHPI